jgi:FkbH-like protein
MTTADARRAEPSRRTVKCVVWDLDNTIWEGILLEDEAVALRQDAVAAIKALDERGILNSIASRNDCAAAIQKLEEFGLRNYFVYPRIDWNAKVASVEAIARAINIGTDAIAFVDDQAFERDAISFSLPEVLCIDAADVRGLADRPEFAVGTVTAEARDRRRMLLGDMARRQAEADFVGSQEEFLATLGMVFTIGLAGEDDLARAEELTLRTNQLNATGYTYSYEELDAFRTSPRHRLFMASLEDRYGRYGKIGLALLELGEAVWTLKLLLMSCRVMSRGVGGVLLNYVKRLARSHQVTLRAEFVPTDRNRQMYVTFKFAGFTERASPGRVLVLEADLATGVPAFPEYVTVRVPDTDEEARADGRGAASAGGGTAAC